MTRGRPIRGIFGGLLLGIFLALDLILAGVVPLDSNVITILPIVLMVVGFALGMWAPLGRSKTPDAPVPQVVPTPAVAWPEPSTVEGNTPPPPFGSPAAPAPPPAEPQAPPPPPPPPPTSSI